MFELMEDSTKMIIGAVVALIVLIGIVGGGFYYFKQHTEKNNEITYPDGCKEVLKDGKLTTPICVNGRAMLQQQRIASGGN